ncbi:riboflavin transporter [Clostridia bacterium]|nr:riboflavin transporter [Clostridia bacterium]
MRNNNKIRMLTRVSLLAAMAVVLSYIETPPFLPAVPFLRLDFAAVPTAIAAMVGGLPAAAAVLLVGNAFHLLVTHTAGIGELANFLMGFSLIWPFAVFSRSEKLLQRVTQGVFATVSIVSIGAASNYILLLPFYGIPHDAALDMLPWISLFNVIKGAAVSIVVGVLPNSLIHWLKRS